MKSLIAALAIVACMSACKTEKTSAGLDADQAVAQARDEGRADLGRDRQPAIESRVDALPVLEPQRVVEQQLVAGLRCRALAAEEVFPAHAGVGGDFLVVDPQW